MDAIHRSGLNEQISVLEQESSMLFKRHVSAFINLNLLSDREILILSNFNLRNISRLSSTVRNLSFDARLNHNNQAEIRLHKIEKFCEIMLDEVENFKRGGNASLSPAA